MTRYRQYADSEQKLLRHLCRRRIDVEHPASASPGLTRSLEVERRVGGDSLALGPGCPRSHRNFDSTTCSLTMSSHKQSLATPVTTLGNPEVLSSKPISSKDSKFVELNALTYRAAKGTEVCLCHGHRRARQRLV